MKNSFVDKNLEFTFEYPERWSCEIDGNVISIYNAENGFGALQISFYSVDNIERINIKEELEFILKLNDVTNEIEMLNEIAYSELIEDESAWQYWLFRIKNTLIIATYNCEKDDYKKEYNIIKNIIESCNSASASF